MSINFLKFSSQKTHLQEFSNNPNEKFLLMILCSQAKLENDNRVINVKRGIRAKCGARVVEEEKIRNYKNGNTRRFVYYHCSRQVDNSCREPFVREADIVSELMQMCDELITDTTKLEPGLRDAIDKFSKMMLVTHKTYGKKNMIGGYVKYVLAEGSQFEKRGLLET